MKRLGVFTDKRTAYRTATALMLAAVMSLSAACGGQTAGTKQTTAPAGINGESTDSSAAATGPSVTADRTRYVMDLTLDEQAKSIGGNVTLTVKNDSGKDWNDLCLRDYPSLFTKDMSTGDPLDGKVSDISDFKDVLTGDSLPIARSDADASVIHVALKTPVKAGEARDFTFSYTSYIPTLTDRFGFFNGVFNLSGFFPILAVYDESGWVTEPYFANGECFYSLVSDFEATFKIPDTMTLISTGDHVRGADGIWTVTAKEVRDLAVVAGSGFKVASKDVDGIKLNCYYLVNDPAWGEVALTAAETSLKAFTQAFGDYPYDELDVVQTNLMTAGVEFPALIMVSNVLGATQDPDGSLSVIIAHGTGHQWFYSLVGNDQYKEAWLDESFASYAEFVYMETYLQKSAVADRVLQVENSMKTQGMPMAKENFRLDAAYNEFDNYYDYMYTVYQAGKVFLYRLREAMGEEAFDAFIKEYVKTYSNGVVTTANFVAAVKEKAPDNAAVDTLLAQYLQAAR